VQASQITATGATLSWTQVSGATSYNIYQNSNPTPIATPTVTTAAITGLSSATVYNFRVAAYSNATGEGTLSDPCTVTTLVGQVQGLATTSVTSSSIALSWTALTGATSYKIYLGPAGGTLAVVGTSNTNSGTINSGITGSTSYDIQVAGTDSTARDGALSVKLTVNTPAAPVAGLVAYLPLQANYNDTSGNNHNGTLTDTGSVSSFPIDGVRNKNVWASTSTAPYITLTGLSLTSTFTCSFFARTPTSGTGFSGIQTMLGTNTAFGTANSFMCYLSSGTLTAFIYDNASTQIKFTDSAPLSYNTWYFITVVHDSTAHTLTVYKDAVAQTPVSSTGSTFSPTIDLQINRSGTFTGLQGAITNVSVYNTALTQSAISSLRAAQY
jgi:hypothetical protein